MTKRDLKIVQESIIKTIKETVNGKIDNLSKKIDENHEMHRSDMGEIMPFIQGAQGLSVLWKIVIGLVGAIVLFGQFKQLFPQL